MRMHFLGTAALCAVVAITTAECSKQAEAKTWSPHKVADLLQSKHFKVDDVRRKGMTYEESVQEVTEDTAEDETVESSESSSTEESTSSEESSTGESNESSSEQTESHDSDSSGETGSGNGGGDDDPH